MESNKKKLIENYFEMPILENNYINWGDFIEDYIEGPLQVKKKVLPSIRYDENEWNIIKQKFYSEAK